MPPKKCNTVGDKSKNQSIIEAFGHNQNISPSMKTNSPKTSDGKELATTSKDLINSLTSNKTIDNIKNVEDVKSTLLIMAKALESLACAQAASCVTTSNLTNDLEQLSDHVNNQLTNLEDNLAVHKNETEEKLMASKVTADIRQSKHFLKIFLKDDKRMKEITRVNAATEATKILHELKLSIGSSRIVKAETKFEKRNLFGPLRFIKHIVITFNDFVTAERLLFDFLKQKRDNRNNSGADGANTVANHSLSDKYYLEIPSTFEMRKIMSVCKELKKEEEIERVFYGPNSINAIMKKKNADDKNEIPKKYEMTNFSQIDGMRKKFNMKNSELPSKQIYTKDYWQKRRYSSNKDSVHSKRKREKSFEKSFEGMEAAKRDKKEADKSISSQISDSSTESYKDTDQ